LFLAFIGLSETGIIRLGVTGAPVHVGDFHQASVMLAIAGFLLIAFLMMRRVHASILISILAVSGLAFLLNVAPFPAQIVSLPPDLSPILLKLDIFGALNWGFFAVLLTIFVMDFVDTLGTLIGLALKADLLDSEGNLPEIEKPMLCDALATTFAALVGTTSSGAYIESATGIEAGGRSGLTAVVTAILFLSALFFAPLFAAIPSFAYGPALIIVGFLMIAPITRLRFDDLSETVPAFTVIVLMSFTYNIGIGMTAGFVVYPLAKIVTGRWRVIRPGMWVLAAMSLLFFILYPY
jgi:AGZA family xanthine/uracil permease-like MFS transporter